MNHSDPAADLFERRNDPDEWEEEASDVAVKPRRTEVVSFRLPSEQLDELERQAKNADQSLSEFIRTAIDAHLHGSSTPQTCDFMLGGKGSFIVEIKAPQYWARSTAEYADLWTASEIVPDYPPGTATIAGE